MQIEFPPFPTREQQFSNLGCFRRAIVEKYFAAALPDAARKSTREETFDLMEYVDSKVSCPDVMEVASGQKDPKGGDC